jgi:RimJ/RimL family protein N-acetyltransferase
LSALAALDCRRSSEAVTHVVGDPVNDLRWLVIQARAATVEDLPDAVVSYERVAGEGIWIGGELPVDRAARVSSWRDHYVDGDGVMFVVIANAEVVGAATQNWLGRCGSGLLSLGMWVVEPWRGKGVGTALLTACIDWARAHGAHKITLEVWPHNERARALYRKFRFEEEGYLHNHWRRRSGELWDSIVMGLLL